MSDGFAGAQTKSMEHLEAEIEKRSAKFADTVRGQDTSKVNNNYQDKHTDSSSEDSTSSLPIHAKNTDLDGVVSDPQQKAMDELDKEVGQYEAQNKTDKEAFPGAANPDRLAGDMAKYKAEIKKDMGAK